MPKKKESSDPAAVLAVRVQPRASRNEAGLREDGSLKVRLTALPVDNAANEALVRFLADLFAVPRSAVEILSGLTGREKRVRIAGITGADVARLLKAREE